MELQKHKMRYQLQKGDYRLLWLLMTPEEIAKEFGEHSQSPRTIRRLFSKISPARARLLRKQMVRKIEALIPPNEDPKKWLETELESQRQEAVNGIWERIKKTENQWDSI